MKPENSGGVELSTNTWSNLVSVGDLGEGPREPAPVVLGKKKKEGEKPEGQVNQCPPPRPPRLS